uniref:Uncharacterized protein n=1 Tax=viral metagenome TaxID=1070528 RepID=A0A6M3J9U5_9ZZZZ
MIGRQGRSGDSAMSRKTLTLSGGAGAHADNLFLVTAPVLVSEIYGVVTTALAAGLTGAYLDLWDGVASVPLTLNAAVLTSLPAGSWMGKQDVAATAMTVQSAAAGALVEQAAGLPPMHPFEAVPKAAVATYIRLRHTSAGTSSGVIEFRVAYHSHGSGGISAA